MIIDVAKVFFPATVSFALGIFFTPFLTHFLYKHKLWKKKVRSKTTDGKEIKVFKQLHAHKEIGTPKLGGVVIWSATFATVFLFWWFARVTDSGLADKMQFLSKNQTWLPLFTLAIGALLGLIDDLLEVSERSDYAGGGLSLKKRLFLVALTGLFGGLWFFFKLDVSTIIVPFLGEVELGMFIIPLYIFTTLTIYSGGVIDGIDGLAGGVFSTIFAAYAGIAFFQSQFDLAALSAVIVGGLFAFLWFNIPPARFYMSETGSMSLTMALAMIAFLTKAVIVLPIIAFPLIATTASDVLQLASKKFRGKKIFLIAPLHHHFEAIGWPAYKVAMRYWIFAIMCALVGMLIALVGQL